MKLPESFVGSNPWWMDGHGIGVAQVGEVSSTAKLQQLHIHRRPQPLSHNCCTNVAYLSFGRNTFLRSLSGMKYEGHLWLDEAVLGPASEWEVPCVGWWFLRIVEGYAYWLGGSEVKEAGVDEVLVLFPKGRGVLRASQLGAVRVEFFRFCPELLGGVLTISERQSLQSLAQRGERVVQVYAADDPASVMYATRLKSKQGWRLRCHLLGITANLLTRELAPSKSRPAATFSARKRVKALMDQLTEAEVLTFSSADLASRCGCSVRYFRRLFLGCFGVSFREKRSELRLAKARQMLVETNLKVIDVARASGYRHLGLFNARFKRQFGVTPSQCRMEARPRRSGRLQSSF